MKNVLSFICIIAFAVGLASLFYGFADDFNYKYLGLAGFCLFVYWQIGTYLVSNKIK